ncbi:DUF1850 domain-containing protein [Marinospirillum sp. MEB164]|uniref:DUF1850 domain-containing protein n=1 Tax=Marinospirillum alkalitolerans TaxID=3123374 RepID=A0ABW8PY70_9GAMM
MMRLPSKLVYGAGFGLLLLVFSSWPVPRLIIEAEGFACQLNTPRFTLSWIHSVEHSRWEEDYQLVASGFLLYTTRMESFGAGSPYQLTPSASQQEGVLEYTLERHFNELHWFISPSMDAQIITPSEKYYFSTWVEQMTSVHFTLQSRPLILTLFAKETCHAPE